MCIVMLKKQDGKVSKKELKQSFDNNPDGSGYLFAKDSNLTVKKGFFKFAEFWDNFSRDMIEFDNPVSIIHFRIKTHGVTNKLNCHPFLVNDGIGFAHNGIISFVNDHKKKSDTLMFKREILEDLPNGFIFNDSIMKLIEESIGTSKLVFLDADGFHRIANETLGHWSDDKLVWYSNKSYCDDIYSPYGNVYVNSFYKDYDNLNITNKKKNTDNIERNQCRTCYSGLLTLGERNFGHCYKCQTDNPKRI